MIDYIINKEKRTIVAMIKFYDKTECFKDADGIFDDAYSLLRRIRHDNYLYDKTYFTKNAKMFFPNHIAAKAKCSPNDEWNEEFGKELARKRLVEKIHNYRSNSYKIVGEMIEEIYDKFIG